MKHVWLLAEAFQQHIPATEDNVILIDEIKILERDMVVGLYYWPWKGEFVCWATFGHENHGNSGGALRGMNWGNYYDGRRFTADLGDTEPGVLKALRCLRVKAERHGWVDKAEKANYVSR